MKQAIRVRGWISTAKLINPRKLFTDEIPRYYLAIQPEDPIVFDEPQEQVVSHIHILEAGNAILSMPIG